MELYVPLLSLTGLDENTVEFITGTGKYGPTSDLLGIGVSWLFYWFFIHGMYYFFGYLLILFTQNKFSYHGTNNVPPAMRTMQILQSEKAFPLYTFVPVLCDIFRKKGLSQLTFYYTYSFLIFIIFFCFLFFCHNATFFETKKIKHK